MTAPERPPHHAFPWVRIVTVVAVMSIGVSLLWVVIRQFDDSGMSPVDPSATPTNAESSPTSAPSTATPATDGTPDVPSEPAWPAGSLPAMLGLAPDRLSDDSLPLNDAARYADIAGWMEINGIEAPASLDDPALGEWEGALDSLALPASLRERGLDGVWRRTYGFDLTQLEQVLIIGQAPDFVMILRGRFDPDELQAAWVTSGYQAVELEGQTIWSLFPEGDTIDLSAQESRPAMGTMNNVVMLENGTLVAAAKMSRLGSVLQVVNGNAPSLAEHDDVAALLVPETGVGQMVSAVLSRGTLLQSSVDHMPIPMSTPSAASPPVGPEGTPEAEPGMPEVNLVLTGLMGQGRADTATPVAMAHAGPFMTTILVFDDLEEAERAGAEVSARLAGSLSPVTVQPYGDRLDAAGIEVGEGEVRSLVIVRGELVNGPADWLAILSDRDLGYAFWLPEP